MVKRCLDFFSGSQNADGGWGKHSFSTAEETAYVALALCYGLKCGYSIPEQVLKKASQFLCSLKCKVHVPLWLAKVLYCPRLIADSAIVAGRYSLAKTIKLLKVEHILKETQFEYIELNFKIDKQENYSNLLLCPSPKFDTDKYSNQIARVETYIINRLIEFELISTSKTILNSFFVKGSFYCLRCKLSDEDLILHATAGIAFLVSDDIYDKSWQLFRNHPIIIKQVLQTFLKILDGEYENIDMIPP